jgi:hypothetical protein
MIFKNILGLLKPKNIFDGSEVNPKFFDFFGYSPDTLFDLIK